MLQLAVDGDNGVASPHADIFLKLAKKWDERDIDASREEALNSAFNKFVGTSLMVSVMRENGESLILVSLYPLLRIFSRACRERM